MPDFRLNNDDIRFDFWRIIERRINDGKLSMDYWTLSIYQFAYVSVRRVVRRSHESAWTEWLLMMLSASFACGLPSMSLLQSSTQFSLNDNPKVSRFLFTIRRKFDCAFYDGILLASEWHKRLVIFHVTSQTSFFFAFTMNVNFERKRKVFKWISALIEKLLLCFVSNVRKARELCTAVEVWLFRLSLIIFYRFVDAQISLKHQVFGLLLWLLDVAQLWRFIIKIFSPNLRICEILISCIWETSFVSLNWMKIRKNMKGIE